MLAERDDHRQTKPASRAIRSLRICLEPMEELVRRLDGGSPYPATAFLDHQVAALCALTDLAVRGGAGFEVVGLLRDAFDGDRFALDVGRPTRAVEAVHHPLVVDDSR